MKKVFLTVWIALFAMVVMGQSLTAPKSNATVVSQPTLKITEIKQPFTELAKCIKDWVNMNMVNYTIVQAQKVEKRENGKSKPVVTYEVKVKPVEKFMTTGKGSPQWLLFAEPCTFSRKISGPTIYPK
jgi:hypothetical protein